MKKNMNAIIATYFKTEKAAAKKAEENSKLWRGKIAWYVLCAKNGYFVISETVARKCFPEMEFGYKDRRYLKPNGEDIF